MAARIVAFDSRFRVDLKVGTEAFRQGLVPRSGPAPTETKGTIEHAINRVCCNPGMLACQTKDSMPVDNAGAPHCHDVLLHKCVVVCHILPEAARACSFRV